MIDFATGKADKLTVNKQHLLKAGPNRWPSCHRSRITDTNAVGAQQFHRIIVGPPLRLILPS
jgi:hypothetical protein